MMAPVMSTTSARRLLLAAVVGSLLACQRQEKVPPADVIATLGEQVVRYPELEAHLARSLGDEAGALAPAVMSKLLDQFLDERLLAELAIARGLPEPGTGRAAAEALLALYPAQLIPTDSEIADYYAANGQEFARPERVHLRQILVTERALAERAIAELRRGVDFAEVAARLSADPRAAQAGDQGVLSRDDLPPAFVEPIFALAPGESSEIVTADYGFLIFQVLARWPAETLPLAEAAAEIRTTLSRRRADQLLDSLLAEARTTFPVTVLAGNLPFSYQGIYVSPATS